MFSRAHSASLEEGNWESFEDTSKAPKEQKGQKINHSFSSGVGWWIPRDRCLGARYQSTTPRMTPKTSKALSSRVVFPCPKPFLFLELFLAFLGGKHPMSNNLKPNNLRPNDPMCCSSWVMIRVLGIMALWAINRFKPPISIDLRPNPFGLIGDMCHPAFVGQALPPSSPGFGLRSMA